MGERVTIDLISFDATSDEYVLYLVEDRPWPKEDADLSFRLKVIQERILSAVDIAVDGHLARQHAEASGKGIRIQVDSPGGAPEALDQLVAAVGRFIVADQSYADAVAQSPYVRGIRIVTGKQLGRFAAKTVS